MANIRVDSPTTIYDGQTITFKSPADCSQITGLVIYYPEGDATKSKDFKFVDAHGVDVGSGTISLFAANALVKVVLDTDHGKAYVQNADTNAYLESMFAGDQKPVYTVAAELTALTPGEKLSAAFGKIAKAITDLISHLANKSNPHGVTKAQIGLGNVDNTSDANKPVSTAQATAIADAKKAGTDAQANLTAHNTNTGAHADIRASLTELSNWVKDLLDSDDETLNEMHEVVAYIKSNKSLIDAITISKVSVADIVNDLVTNATNKPLSAAQGVAIKGLIDALQTAVNEKSANGHKHTMSEITDLNTETWTFTLEDGTTVTKAVYIG